MEQERDYGRVAVGLLHIYSDHKVQLVKENWNCEELSQEQVSCTSHCHISLLLLPGMVDRWAGESFAVPCPQKRHDWVDKEGDKTSSESL